MLDTRSLNAWMLIVLSTCAFSQSAIAADTVTADTVSANKSADGAKNNQFQAEVPIGMGKARSDEQLIKRNLLSEKLVKMGRARSQGCTRCHGRSGMYTMARSAKWDGSVTEFVAVQLTAFRDGQRVHAIMSSVAKPLSDQDIALIATWYESVSPKNDK